MRDLDNLFVIHTKLIVVHMPFDWIAYFTYNITLKKHVAITYWMHKKNIRHTTYATILCFNFTVERRAPFTALLQKNTSVHKCLIMSRLIYFNGRRYWITSESWTSVMDRFRGPETS